MVELKAAPDTRIRVLATYLRQLQAIAKVAPYEKLRSLNNTINAEIDVKPLEEQRWSVLLTVGVAGFDTDGVECVSYVLQMEALVSAVPEDLEDAVVLAAGTLLADIRAKLSALSGSTGFGVIVIPALKPEQLKELRRASSPEVEPTKVEDGNSQ